MDFLFRTVTEYVNKVASHMCGRDGHIGTDNIFNSLKTVGKLKYPHILCKVRKYRGTNL